MSIQNLNFNLAAFLSTQQHQIPQGANPFTSICVDGRLRRENMKGVYLTAPGGNAGHLAVALAVRNELYPSVDREVFVKALIDTLGGVQNFGMHDLTDALSGNHDPHCGHFAQILKNPQDYGLNNEDIEFLRQTLPELKNQGAREEILEGNHAEQAIIIITNPDIYVVPCSEEGRQAFVYHKALNKMFYDAFAAKLAEIAGVNKDEIAQAMKIMAETHLKNTLQRLPSAKGLKTFEVK